MIWWDTKVELLLKTHRKTENCLREFGRSQRRGRLNTRSAFNSVQQNLLVVSVHEYELYVNLFQLFSDSTGDLAVELLERPNEILIFKRELLWTTVNLNSHQSRQRNWRGSLCELKGLEWAQWRATELASEIDLVFRLAFSNSIFDLLERSGLQSGTRWVSN